MKNLSEIILNWHSLFRTEHALITFIGVIVGQLLVVRSFSLSLLFPALGPALITLAAFALNDYFGYETDKANARKDRPLVNGAIAKSHALYAAFVLFVVGLALTYLINLLVFALALVYVVLSIAYDPILKKLPLLGNAFIALSMAAPFLYGNLAVSPVVVQLVVLICSIAFLVGVGRELLITLRDVKGDKKIGATTLPMLIGAKATVVLSAVFILAAIALSIVPLLSSFSLTYFVFLVPCVLLLLLTIYKALKSQEVVMLKQCRNYTLFALLFGVVAFLALALL
ncbi:MAG: UbiA family prenyltransferase [Candidatus Micrarchaeota archaeon]